MIFGQNRDALVLKFISKLKKKVMERKDEEAQKQKENFIKSVIKKMDFNSVIKHTNIEIEEKKKPANATMDKLSSLFKNKIGQKIEMGQNISLIKDKLTQQIKG